MFISDILQPTHLLLILAAILLVLGPKRLPEAGRAIGRGIREFKGGIDGEKPPEAAPVLQRETAPAKRADPGV